MFGIGGPEILLLGGAAVVVALVVVAATRTKTPRGGAPDGADDS